MDVSTSEKSTLVPRKYYRDAETIPTNAFGKASEKHRIPDPVKHKARELDSIQVKVFGKRTAKLIPSPSWQIVDDGPKPPRSRIVEKPYHGTHIRSMEKNDIPALTRIMTDDFYRDKNALSYYAPWKLIEAEKDVSVLHRYAKNLQLPDPSKQVFIAQEDGKVVGAVALKKFTHPIDADIMYYFGKKRTPRSGLATKSVQEAITAAFANDPKLERILADPHPGNMKSLKVIQHQTISMRPLLTHELPSTMPSGNPVYVMTRPEWQLKSYQGTHVRVMTPEDIPVLGRVILKDYLQNDQHMKLFSPDRYKDWKKNPEEVFDYAKELQSPAPKKHMFVASENVATDNKASTVKKTVGFVGINMYDHWADARMKYWFTQQRQPSSGLATQSVIEAVDAVFTGNPLIKRIVASVSPKNEKSLRLLRNPSLAFREIQPGDLPCSGYFTDEIPMILTRSQWEQLRKPSAATPT